MGNRLLMTTAFAAALGGIAPLPVQAVTLTFDELTTRPVQGLETSGVAFGFMIGTQTSQDAVYNRPGPSGSALLSGAVLEGDARGVLTLRFPTPTSALRFDVALSAPSDLQPGLTVQLTSPGTGPTQLQTVATFRQGSVSETRFDYAGLPLDSAVLNFNDALLAGPSRFAIDNLTFLPAATSPGTPGGQVPVPSSSALVGLGILALSLCRGCASRRS